MYIFQSDISENYGYISFYFLLYLISKTYYVLAPLYEVLTNSISLFDKVKPYIWRQN
jgi:hypothetical protein